MRNILGKIFEEKGKNQLLSCHSCFPIGNWKMYNYFFNLFFVLILTWISNICWSELRCCSLVWIVKSFLSERFEMKRFHDKRIFQGSKGSSEDLSEVIKYCVTLSGSRVLLKCSFLLEKNRSNAVTKGSLSPKLTLLTVFSILFSPFFLLFFKSQMENPPLRSLVKTINSIKTSFSKLTNSNQKNFVLIKLFK